jgi:hypothetical protein
MCGDAQSMTGYASAAFEAYVWRQSPGVSEPSGRNGTVAVGGVGVE